MTKRRVLVDTSVFVDFLRSVEPANRTLKHLLDEGWVVLSSFVKLELLFGVRKTEQRLLSDLLDSLQRVPVTEELMKTAETLLSLSRQKGLNAGLVDYLIVIQALSNNCTLLSRDFVMRRLAKLLEVELFEE